MRNLVRRYVTVEQRKAESQGVTEDDVNEIKQDISAFRCELVEILKNSGMNTSTASGAGGGERNHRLCAPCLRAEATCASFCVRQHALLNYAGNEILFQTKFAFAFPVSSKVVDKFKFPQLFYCCIFLSHFFPKLAVRRTGRRSAD
jgi:hypothetical protein